MPTSPDCTLCLLRQSLEAARMTSADPQCHLLIVEEVMKLILREGLATAPPVIGQKIHRLIRELSQCPDPYLEGKRFFNELLLSELDALREQLGQQEDRLACAVRWAIAGNSIDFALGQPDRMKVPEILRNAISQPINGSLSDFKELIDSSSSILYLTDNAGEIVCDRLLVELLIGSEYGKKVTVAVRGKPILNDATRDDALRVGLSALVPVIDNGNDGLGTMLEQCSPEFISAFRSADLVLAKGLANYETLVENDTEIQPKRIVFLFKAKCPFISHYAGTKLGDFVIKIL